MVNHLKRYRTFGLYALLVNIALIFPVHLMATQEVPLQEETAQVAKDTEQSDEKESQKPTFAQSWHKVITLRWKELSKTDAWNIGAPVVSIVALSAWYYWPKNGFLGNQNNNDDNPFANLDRFLPEGLDIPENLDFEFPSYDDLDDNLGNSNLLANINNEFPNEIQTKIALHRIRDFLNELKLKRRDELVAQEKLKTMIVEPIDIASSKEWLRYRCYNHLNFRLELRKALQKFFSCPVFAYLELPEDFIGVELNQEYINNPISCLASWIRRDVTIPQTDLLIRAYIHNTRMKIQKGPLWFTIYCLSEDGKVFLTFPKEVRMALLKSLLIDLRMEKAPE